MILYNIDSPSKEEEAFESTIVLTGWAFSTSGPITCSVTIAGKLMAAATANALRPDVGVAFPQYEGSNKSGFTLSMSLEGLSASDLHSLVVKFSDPQGDIVEEVRRFRINSGELKYHKYYIAEKEAEYSELVGFERFKMQFCIEYTNLHELCKTLYALEIAGYSKCNSVVFAPSHSLEEIRNFFTYYQKSKPLLSDTIEKALRLLDNRFWVALLKSGELIERRFGQQLSAATQILGSDAMVFDHDHCREDGLHHDPCFKPAWSYHLYLAKDYVDGGYCARVTALLDAIDKLGPIAYTTCWRYELLLKLHEDKGSIRSLHRVLVSKNFSGKKELSECRLQVECVQRHLDRLGRIAKVIDLGRGNRKVEYEIKESPKVSIIIPTTGKMKYVQPLIDSILLLTIYENFELILIDNGRGENRDGINYIKSKGLQVLERFEAFNWSKLNNYGVANSGGELLLFLNDDIEVVDPSWLTQLVLLISQENVGAVSPMLVYPNGLIQHAGVFLVDHGGGARHFLQYLNPEQDIHMDYQKVVREVTAGTGACLLIKRKIFLDLNGFDEELPVVGNDVDICLRIRKAGYSILWTPESKLIHHESVSREHIEYLDDERRMWERWSELYLKGDPFYNRNLTLLKSDCSRRVSVNRLIKSTNKNNNLGANIIGYFKAEMGLGEGVRGLARALETTSVCTQIVNYIGSNPARMQDLSFMHLISDQMKFSINIWHINPDLLSKAMDEIATTDNLASYNIAFWAWELPELPLEWSDSIELIDEIWVPSEFVAKAVRARTEKPVNVFPHPVTKVLTSLLNRKYFNLPEDSCIFLMAYDVNSIRQRKNPDDAISAFQKAFDKNDMSVMLLIKINSANPEEIKYINRKIKNYSNIRVITFTLDRIEMDSLLNMVNCFVSLHRSEGFGLLIAEALIFGKPVLATAWSGNMDFMDNSYPFLVDFKLISITEPYGPYKKGQIWADPDIDHASKLMKRIAKDIPQAQQIAEQEKIRVENFLSPERIGLMMQKRILEIECFRNSNVGLST